MRTYLYPTSAELIEVLKRPEKDSYNLESLVKEIFDDVKLNGDDALRAYSLKFDRVDLPILKVTEEEFNDAKSMVSADLKEAIQIAKNNIIKFHEAQKEEVLEIETMSGVTCWRKSVGIEKVGLYIPGGTAPLFSTVLMLGIPAVLAGCKRIVLCTPADKNGNINPAILYTAQLIGISEVYKVGGIQAIAAMTYGTESILKVYKIFGPGNQYVTAAKQFAQQLGIAIDMPAGPSELMVIADECSNAAFVASDLLSQAEHGEDSQVILISTCKVFVYEVEKEVFKQLEFLPRRDIAIKALQNSAAIVVQRVELLSIINEYGPEHLILSTCFDDELIDGVINAGSVFIGKYTPESAGDYASGTNHTLPTNGYSKQYSGVSLDSFVKKITFQKISKEGIKNIGKTIETMAEAEGLQAHKNAVTLRLNSLS
jgi:histidinol dehydrogenase